jgi:hypothetical protein
MSLRSSGLRLLADAYKIGELDAWNRMGSA